MCKCHMWSSASLEAASLSHTMGGGSGRQELEAVGTMCQDESVIHCCFWEDQETSVQLEACAGHCPSLPKHLAVDDSVDMAIPSSNLASLL